MVVSCAGVPLAAAQPRLYVGSSNEELPRRLPPPMVNRVFAAVTALLARLAVLTTVAALSEPEPTCAAGRVTPEATVPVPSCAAGTVTPAGTVPVPSWVAGTVTPAGTVPLLS